MAKSQKIRSNKGTIILVVLILAIMVILPLGLYGFELSRLCLAQAQLRSATDAAALAAAQIMSQASEDEGASKKKATEAALNFFRKNTVISQLLKNSRVSGSVGSDNPNQGEATLNDSFDEGNRIVASAAYGLPAAFQSLLGVHTIRANSLSGSAGLDGDIVIVVDSSGSMMLASKSVIVSRYVDKMTGKLVHKIVGESNYGAHLGPRNTEVLVPELSTIDFSKSAKFAQLQNAPDSVKLAALYEAKQGNLENSAIFKKSEADKSDLAQYIQPGSGFQSDYQKIALDKTEPLASEKLALNDFISQLESNQDAHFSLVTYAGEVSHSNHKDEFATNSGHELAHVGLSSGAQNGQEIKDSIAAAPVFSSTNTGGAINEATEILTSGQHRPGSPKTIVLLTDGVPTSGPDYNKAARNAGKNGIKLLTVGFFLTEDTRQTGPGILNGIVANAGNGSKAFLAPDVPGLKLALREISEGGPRLINK